MTVVEARDQVAAVHRVETADAGETEGRRSGNSMEAKIGTIEDAIAIGGYPVSALPISDHGCTKIGKFAC